MMDYALVDPEGRERKTVHEMVDVRGLRVLDIGCGAARLTREYAEGARRIVGVDPDRERLAAAARAQSPGQPPLRFLLAEGQALPFAAGVFDAAFLAWSL